MKKLTSIILIVATILSCVTVFADSTTSDEMQDVLIKVKEKVDIPTEYTEFTPRTSKQKDKVNYYFMWQTEQGDAYIEVSADDEGRILNYYAYDNSLKSDKRLTDLSKEDIIGFAEGFLKKIVPETVENENDRLVYDEKSWNVYDLSYQMYFRRVRNGVEVKDNNASLSICVYDNKAYVRNAYINFNYEAKFNDVTDVIDDYEEKYKAEFPIEIIYQDEYYRNIPKTQRDKAEDKVVLIYRFKDNKYGYILAETGAVVEEDADKNGYFEEAKAMADTVNSAGREMLTEQEIKELGIVEGLVSRTDIEEILKKLPYINFDGTLEFEYQNINKSDEKYYMSLGYQKDDNRYLSVTANGETGEIQSIYNRAYDLKAKNVVLTKAEKSDVNKKMDEFLNAVAGDKQNMYEKYDESESEYRMSRNYDRVVNGVRYISDSIYVEFDNEAKQISNYRLDYDDRAFDSPEKAIDSIDAYDKLLEISPLKKLYVQTDGVYNVCFTVTDAIMLDAFAGKKYPEAEAEEVAEFKYSDIEEHWARDMINKLAEIQIGFTGEKFNPDQPITQYDLLRLFGAGIRYKSYLSRDKDSLYDDLINEGILTEEEKKPDDEVSREDACVYMIRYADLEDVAKLSHIFKVEYSDGQLISKDKIGYPAILTGMGVICGNGGKLRPTDSITRAEAMVMIYNYMTR